MAWYRTGTVAVTNNSNVVTGTGTSWVDGAAIGETFLGPDAQVYEITSIVSGTSLRISPNYKGGTSTAQSYAIMPTQGYLRDLAAQAAALVNSYQAVRDGAGQGKFSAGTVTAPSLRGAADENTGINLPGNDILQFITGGAVRLQLAADGTPTGVFTQKLPVSTATQTAINNLAAASVALADVGSAPGELPSNQHLGALAFLDTLGVTQLLQHTPDAAPGSTWKQVVGDSFEEKLVKPNGEVVDVTPLKLMQSFGLGAKDSPLITDLSAHRTGGIFRVDGTQVVAFGLPLNLQHLVLYIPGSSTANGVMFLTPTSASEANSGRCWMRKLNSNAWQTPKEISFTDSPAFTGTPSTPNLKLENIASADANTLDYYEEGSWTPYLKGATTAGSPTYVARYGGYTRVGDTVFISGQVQLSSRGGMVGEIKLEGLPFSTKNVANHLPPVSIAFQTGINANLLLSINRDTTQVNIYKLVTGNTEGVFASEVTDNFRISFSATYKV